MAAERRMAKHCQTLDHTADVGLVAQADTLEELFEALAEGLCDVVCPRAQVTAAECRTVRVSAEDLEALLVDFLNEVLWALQTERFAVASVRVARCDGRGVSAELRGEPYDPRRHELAGEVKAATYHQLRVARERDRWAGRVILDI
jgi:SHS2 domain-containing protein